MYVPLERCHLEAIRPQAEQRDFGETADFDLLLKHTARALITDRVEACYGVIQEWEGRGGVWAVLAEHPRMVAIHRAISAALQEDWIPTRTDMIVKAGFKEGCRWARMLGFEPEGMMRQYLQGQDYWLYARIAGAHQKGVQARITGSGKG